MKSPQRARFPKSARKRFAEILLRHVYQCGGRERYVPVVEIEDALGLEPWLILDLARRHLGGEIHVAYRVPAELAESTEFRTALERQWIRDSFSRPHVRIRPECVRLTEEELLEGPTNRRRKRKKQKKRG